MATLTNPEYVPHANTLHARHPARHPDLRRVVPAHLHCANAVDRPNRDEHNIVFTLHEGDITNGNTEPQWRNAAESMSVLDGKVPYALVMGNHDMGPGGTCEVRDSPLFNEYFPVSRYESLPTFGGMFEPDKMENTYHRFEAAGTGWLIVALEFQPRDRVLQWANDIIASHPDRHVLMLTHSHVCNDATLYGSRPDHNSKPGGFGIATDPEGANDGQETWVKTLRRHENVRFVFNGHFLGSATPSARATRETPFTRCSPTTRTWRKAGAATCDSSSATRRAAASRSRPTRRTSTPT